MTITIPLAVKARESARETACANNLVALIRGVQNYQLTFGFYPSNGWGYRWVGEPGQGPGKDQPGSWAYSTLPYVERLRQSSLDRLDGSQSWISGVEDLLTMPNSLLRCPSRGAGALVNNNPNRVPFNARWLTTVYRTDYVANEGDRHLKTGPGPSRLSDVDTHAWPNNGIATGVMFLRSEITPQQIHDGVSNTYFLGEKYVFFRDYLTFNSAGYDQSGYVGADLDTNRCTSHPPTWDMIELSNAPNKGAQYFGSAHPKFSWFAFGDGSVRPISYNVDPEEYRSAGHRRDGNKMFADATQWR
ncbi:MAG: DUF1559 domain-containing protein [Pirellulales bacterium]|nr:DUF1559 domain-containing protein [Pirellulales bacterium]